MKKKATYINVKPLLYILLGLFIGSLWWTDNAEIMSLKLLATGLALIAVGFLYDTMGGGYDQ